MKTTKTGILHLPAALSLVVIGLLGAASVSQAAAPVFGPAVLVPVCPDSDFTMDVSVLFTDPDGDAFTVQGFIDLSQIGPGL